MIDFQTWLADRSIDCQTLTAELSAALQSQYEAECSKGISINDTPATVLMLPSDCQWPMRGYWIPAITTTTYTKPI